jgi:transcriptional regulator with XRE-family HTH domain
MSKKRFPIFASRLKKILDRNDDTTTTAAKKLGVSRQSIGFYLDGSRIPDGRTIAEIAKTYHISSDYLLGLSDYQSPNIHASFMCRYTGLTENALEVLHDIRASDGQCSGIVSSMISSPYFASLLQAMLRIQSNLFYVSPEDELDTALRPTMEEILRKAEDSLYEEFHYPFKICTPQESATNALHEAHDISYRLLADSSGYTKAMENATPLGTQSTNNTHS